MLQVGKKIRKNHRRRVPWILVTPTGTLNVPPRAFFALIKSSYLHRWHGHLGSRHAPSPLFSDFFNDFSFADARLYLSVFLPFRSPPLSPTSSFFFLYRFTLLLSPSLPTRPYSPLLSSKFTRLPSPPLVRALASIMRVCVCASARECTLTCVNTCMSGTRLERERGTLSNINPRETRWRKKDKQIEELEDRKRERQKNWRGKRRMCWVMEMRRGKEGGKEKNKRRSN